MKDSSKKLEIAKQSGIGLIKGAIDAIPFVGGAINELFFETYGRIHQKRINDFVLLLETQFKKIQEDKISQDYLKSEEFYDLTRIIFESVIQTKSKEKQSALSKVYISAILNKSDLENDFSILFSRFILDLISLQIQIMRFIEQNEKMLIEIGTYDKFYDLFVQAFNSKDLDKYEFKYSCNDLENKALISSGGGLENFDSYSALIALEHHKAASVRLTNLGHKFIELLK